MLKASSILLLCIGLFNAPTLMAVEDGKEIGDWRVQCATAKDEQKNCHIFQDLLEKESKKRVLHIAVGTLPGQQSATAAIITLPLGISLLPGTYFKIDDNEALTLPIQACFSDGCQTILKLEETTLKALKNGDKAEVIFHNISNQAISIPVSLKGFSEAIAAIAE